MNQITVSESEFISTHDRLKREGKRIIRCVERTGGRNGKTFTITWV